MLLSLARNGGATPSCLTLFAEEALCVGSSERTDGLDGFSSYVSRAAAPEGQPSRCFLIRALPMVRCEGLVPFLFTVCLLLGPYTLPFLLGS